VIKPVYDGFQVRNLSKIVHLLKDFVDESSHGIKMPKDVIRETLTDLIDKMTIPEKVKMISGITMKNPSYCADEKIWFFLKLCG